MCPWLANATIHKPNKNVYNFNQVQPPSWNCPNKCKEVGRTTVDMWRPSSRTFDSLIYTIVTIALNRSHPMYRVKVHNSKYRVPRFAYLKNINQTISNSTMYSTKITHNQSICTFPPKFIPFWFWRICRRCKCFPDRKTDGRTDGWPAGQTDRQTGIYIRKAHLKCTEGVVPLP
jgi:hypothetical protein